MAKISIFVSLLITTVIVFSSIFSTSVRVNVDEDLKQPLRFGWPIVFVQQDQSMRSPYFPVEQHFYSPLENPTKVLWPQLAFSFAIIFLPVYFLFFTLINLNKKLGAGSLGQGNHFINCDHCKSPIARRDDLMAVGQFYPNLPVAIYHNACYSNFLKSGKFWIGPRGPVIWSSQKSKKGTLGYFVFFALYIFVLMFVIRPQMPRIFWVDLVYYILLTIGILALVEFMVIRRYVKNIERLVNNQ